MPEPTTSEDKSSRYSSCQSNDSEGSIDGSSDHSKSESNNEEKKNTEPKVVKKCEPVVTKPLVTEQKNETVKPSCVNHIKTPRESVNLNESPRSNSVHRESRSSYNYAPKRCFVCGSLSHLIRDCDFHEKRMKREAEQKRMNVNKVHGSNKPVWNNASRVNHANQFVPRSVLLNNTTRPNSFVSSGRPNFGSGYRNFNVNRQNVNFMRPKVNTGYVNSVRPNVNTGFVRPKQPFQKPQVNANFQRNNFYKAHSPVRRQTNSNGGSADNFSDCWAWNPFKNEFTYKSKHGFTGASSYKTYKYVAPQKGLKPTQAWVAKKN